VDAAAAPKIYHPRFANERASAWARLLAAAVAVACLAVLSVAARIPPNPAGTGSHRALGLQSCAFLDRTGLPCPSCGMTTSFSWFARGNVLASLYVQPMGTVLAVLAAATVWGGLYVAATGRPIYRLFELLPRPNYLFLLPLLAFGVAAWGWKIFIHVKGVDGWR
jgi:hypothetical protein